MLKRLSLILAIALGSSLTTIASAKVKAEPGKTIQAPGSTRHARSYTLSCLIGDANSVQLWGLSSAIVAYIEFGRTRGPASAGLQPGQCAYVDRAVTTHESDFLCFKPILSDLNLAFQARAINAWGFGSSPGGALLHQTFFKPAKLMNFKVHSGAFKYGPCLMIDHFGP